MNTLHRTATLVLMGLAFAAAAQTPASTAPAAATPATEESVTNSALNAPLFYQLLLGEINVRAGEPGTGYSLILDAARKQKDPELYRRAVDVALQARSGEAALTAARAWSQELPGSQEANRFVLQILLALNRVAETGPVLQSILQASSVTDRNDTINAIPQTYGRVTDKALAASVVREALAPSLKQPFHAAAAWTTVGRMELAQDQLPQALASAREGHVIDPASPYPALLALELMERGQGDAETLVRQQLQASHSATAGDSAVALAYARILLDLQRDNEARAQLQTLTTRQPEQAEPWLLLASLQVQDNTLPAATASLQKYTLPAPAPGWTASRTRKTSWPPRCGAPRCWPARGRCRRPVPCCATSPSAAPKTPASSWWPKPSCCGTSRPGSSPTRSTARPPPGSRPTPT